jgi:sortase A
MPGGVLQLAMAPPILSIEVDASRVLGALGRTLITMGVMTLLFVAFQLWGTGLLTAQAQAGLEKDFDALLAEAEDENLVVIAAVPPTPGAGPDADTDADADPDSPVIEPVPTEPPLTAAQLAEQQAARERLAELLWQPQGEVIARLSIPDIGVDERVVEGVGVPDLRKGPGHYGGTPLPGMPGNVAIAGHRTTYGAPFNRINELEPGDEIKVETVQGLFTYRVVEQDSGKGFFIVPPSGVHVLDQDFAESPNRLTLTACHPKYTARQRIIVVAELVGEPVERIARPGTLPVVAGGLASEYGGTGQPAEPTPTPVPTMQVAEATPTVIVETDPIDEDPIDEDPSTVGIVLQGPEPPAGEGLGEGFGEGLNGDDGAVFPAVLWGLAAAAIWLAVSFWGRRWKKWPAYAAGVAPFTVVLFVCFMYIDRALPSY